MTDDQRERTLNKIAAFEKGIEEIDQTLDAWKIKLLTDAYNSLIEDLKEQLEE